MKSQLTYLFTLSFFILVFMLVPASIAGEGLITLESSLRYQDLVVGTEEIAEIGKVVTIHIVMWLDENGQKGQKFFDSYTQAQAINFMIGTDRVMKAWNFGVVGMKVGGKRQLIVPAELGYGRKKVDEFVPPDSDLILEIELLKLEIN